MTWDRTLLNFRIIEDLKTVLSFSLGNIQKSFIEQIYRHGPHLFLSGFMHLCIVSLYKNAEKTLTLYWPSSWSTRACSFHSSTVSKCPAFAHKKTFLEYTHICFPICFLLHFYLSSSHYCCCVFAWLIHLSTLRLYEISFSCRHVKLSGAV